MSNATDRTGTVRTEGGLLNSAETTGYLIRNTWAEWRGQNWNGFKREWEKHNGRQYR